MNAIIERGIGGCRRELLDRTLIWEPGPSAADPARIRDPPQSAPATPVTELRCAAETATRTGRSRPVPRATADAHRLPDQRVPPGRMTWTRFSHAQADPRRPPAPPEDPGQLALGRRHRDRLEPDQRPAARPLTSIKPSLRSRKEHPGPMEPRSPACQPGCRHPPNPNPRPTGRIPDSPNSGPPRRESPGLGTQSNRSRPIA